ncbi:hypothetical protein [Phycicoccus avicenniae]|uniref:hypothetical protein n=1 Tax=Phycicoccus avicenniae TaxID=2828860 RepID=UPI003D272695
MVQHHNAPRSQQLLRGLAVTTSAALTVLALGSGPAAARPDVGPAAATVGHAGQCPLQRVGTQYVRCDDHTGNGVPAPGWVAER